MADIRYDGFTLPYTDWEKAFDREDSVFRYRSLALSLTEEEYIEKGLEPDHVPEFELAKWSALQRFFKYLDEAGLKAEDIHNLTGCDKALLSHMKARRRSWCVPSVYWERIAHDIMHMSVHNLIFGEDKSIVLPRRYAILAGEIQKKATEGDIKRLYVASEKRIELYFKDSEDVCGHHRPMASLIRERFSSIRDDTGFYHYQIFGNKDDGKETPNSLKSGINAFWSDSGKQMEPKYSFLAYAALYYEKQNMDYLVCEDPLIYSDAYGLTRDGELILLTGESKKFWSNILRLNDGLRTDLIESAWGLLFSLSL